MSPPDVPSGPRPRGRALVRALFGIAVLVALGAALVARWDEVAGTLAQLEPWPALAGAVAAVAGVGASGQIWRALMTGLGARLPLRIAARVFFVGQLGKYLPGTMWSVVAGAELGRDHGVERRVSVAGQVLFLWTHVVTGGVLSGIGLAVAGRVPAWVGVAGLAGLVLVVPAPLVAVLDRVLRLLRREPLPARPRLPDVGAAVAWAVVMWVCYGTHLWLLAQALDAPVSWALATGAFAAAWVAGFVVVIAPAGAGVREAVLVALLGGPPGLALTLALLSRAVMTLADALWGLLGLGLRGAAAPRPPSTAAAS